MKKITILILVLLVGVVGVAFAQSGGGYDLTWNTLDGGGVSFATGGGYELGGTIGQPDAATWQGGEYTLSGGFWTSVRIPAPPEYLLYIPIVIQNS